MKKIDRRVRKTKRAIQQAMIDLLRERSFEEVTVQAIAERADIHRGTFYSHYFDKYDVIERWEREIFEQLEQIAFQTELPEKIVASLLTGVPAQEVIDVLTIIDQRREIVRILLAKRDEQSFENRLRRFLNHIFDHNLSTFMKPEQMTIPVDYLKEYLFSAHLGVLRHWLHEEEQERLSSEEIAHLLWKIALEGPVQASAMKEQMKHFFEL